MLAKIKRWGLRTFLIFPLGIVIYVLMALLLSAIPTGELNDKTPRIQAIFVQSNGVHVDIILPKEKIPADLFQQLNPGNGTAYLAFGWGDKGFYLDTPTWSELKTSTALRAMFLSSPTAMHVTDYAEEKATWTKVYIREEQIFQLMKYIRSSFRLDEDKSVIELPGAGYTDHDRFYEAHGHYNAFMTCNTWVNRAFRKVGIRTAFWTPTDSGILRHLEP